MTPEQQHARARLKRHVQLCVERGKPCRLPPCVSIPLFLEIALEGVDLVILVRPCRPCETKALVECRQHHHLLLL